MPPSGNTTDSSRNESDDSEQVYCTGKQTTAGKCTGRLCVVRTRAGTFSEFLQRHYNSRPEGRYRWAPGGTWMRKINASPYVWTRRGIQKERDVLSTTRYYCCCAVSSTTGCRRLLPTRCECDATSPRMKYMARNTPIAAQTLHLAIFSWMFLAVLKSFVEQ